MSAVAVLRSPFVVDERRSFAFPVPPAVMWDDLQHVDRFPTWWRWLRDFEVDGDGLAPGSVLRGTVVPPLPYRLRVRVTIEELEPGRRIAASVDGDLRGPAALELE